MWKNLGMTGIILCLSMAILYVSIFQLDPFGAQKYVAFMAFYLSVFLGTWSFCVFPFFFASEIYHGHKLGSRYFLISVRRAFWVALAVVFCLILQSYRLLGLLEGGLIVAFFGLLEWIFITGKARE